QCGRKLNLEEIEICFSCKELEVMANKAISDQKEIVKFARELAADMRETRETVGDWNGMEEFAAKAMNEIYDAMVEAVEIVSASGRDLLDSDLISILFMHAREQWLADRELLFRTKENHRRFAMNCFKRFM